MISRLHFLSAAALFSAAANASAFLDEWEIDYGQISQAGQEIIDRFAPLSFKTNFRFYSPEELSAAFYPVETALAGGSIEALAAIQPRARQTLESLRANPETQDYADWLEARMDYFEMAAEVERAIPSPPQPAPAQPAPGAPPLMPHPSPSKPPLVPHPQPSAPTLPPHSVPTGPKLAPHEVPPPPPKPTPQPAPQTAQKRQPPPPDVEKARNRYVENKQVWIRKIGSRPPPARAATLLPVLKRVFAEEGIPPQLVWQAEAESSFNPSARSPAGAVGLYQFMPATAQQFGLRLSPDDQRLDPALNARAAAQYLKLLHRRFGNWPLALAAYNCGQGRVAAALRATSGSTFDDIYDKLPAETRMYVPKIAALVHLRENSDVDRLSP